MSIPASPQLNQMIDKLDELLERLPNCQSWQERFDVLIGLVEAWHGPCHPEDGFSEMELAPKFIPPPLLEWYRKGGKRKNILDGHNQLIRPNQLSEWKDEEFWYFYSENQGSYLWALRFYPESKLRFPDKNQLTLPGIEPPKPTRYTLINYDVDDPEVWGQSEQNNYLWVNEEVTLSEFLIQAFVFEAIVLAPYQLYIGQENATVTKQITSFLCKTELGAWHWPSYPTRFYSGLGVFCCTCPDTITSEGEQLYTIMIGARTEKALDFLTPLSKGHWDFSCQNY